jgi:acetyl esterase
MPLDPQVRTFLDQLKKSGAVPPEQLSLPEARRQMEEASRALGPAPAIRSIEERTIPSPGGGIPIRIYRDCDEKNAPGVVYFHGGGWVIGSVSTHDKLCRELARDSGAVVLAVDYRLAPEHKFPAAADDAYTVTSWTAEQTQQLGIDQRKLIVAGDSAGGNLAAVTCLLARDRLGPSISLQVLIYPITDFNFETGSYRDNAQGYYLSRETMQWFWAEYLTSPADGVNPYASPLRAERVEGLPPALVLTAEYDPLRDEGEAYARRLTASGVNVELTRYAGMIHGFIRRPDAFAQASCALKQVCDSIRQGTPLPKR